jgi:hypothetical protein
MKPLKAAVCVAGAAVIVPVTLTRLLWGKKPPMDFFEPTVAAWFATVLEEIDQFGDDWVKDHPSL